MKTIEVQTAGEKFYNITDNVSSTLCTILQDRETTSGVLTLFMPHTSCGLTINEAFDPSAARDMENFLKHLAPRNLSFMQHTTEGPDDSPSHMKSIVLQQSLSIIVEDSKMVIGTWQGIYLAEFRDGSKRRKVYLKFMGD